MSLTPEELEARLQARYQHQVLPKLIERYPFPIYQDYQEPMNRFRELWDNTDPRSLYQRIQYLEEKYHLDMMGDPIPGYGSWYQHHYMYEVGFNSLSDEEVYSYYQNASDHLGYES